MAVPQRKSRPGGGGSDLPVATSDRAESYANSGNTATNDLAFHVRTFVPEAEGEELEQRTKLLIARDHANALRARVSSDRAYDYASAAHEIASEFVFADASLPRLKIAVVYCRNLVQAAFCAEHLA